MSSQKEGKSTKAKAVDLSHHLSDVSKARTTSPLKGLQKYLGKEGLLMMAGGLPSPSYFPFSQLEAEALVPDSFPLAANASSSAPSGLAWLFSLLQGSGSHNKEKTIHLTVPKYASNASDLNLAVALQYGLAKGLPQLQKITDEFTSKVFKPAYEDFVTLIHAGNTDGWFKCVQTFCNPGDGVLVSEWTYPSAIASMTPYGVKPVPVPMDNQGMSADGLRQVLSNWDEVTRAMPRPHLMYIVPVGQNPTGATMGVSRKKDIYAICVEFDVVIAEDDPYYFLQQGPYVRKAERDELSDRSSSSGDEAYLKQLAPSFLSVDYQGRVIRLDSFSKTVSPGCRLGWFTCNPIFAERLERQGEASTQAPCGYGQSMVTALLLCWKTDGYIRWLIALGTQYKQRRDFILDCLGEEFHLKPAYEATGVWGGHEVLRAYDKLEVASTVSEKLAAFQPMFSLVPPTSGMFIWLQLHLDNHPALRGDEDEESLEMKLWIDLAEAGVLFAPGWMFSAKQGQDDGPGSGHFRISFSNTEFDDMKRGITIFGTVMRRFYKKRL